MGGSLRTGLGPLQAHGMVLDFAARGGEALLRLAMHAALPQVLHVELLQVLRLNFAPAVGAMGVADLLFAPFLHALGNDWFEMDPSVRRQLLTRLDVDHRDAAVQRSVAVADLVLAWLDREQRRPRADTDAGWRGWLEAERWNALAFCEPDAAAEQLAAALQGALDNGAAAACLRVGELAQSLAAPLAGHPRLLALAAGLAAQQRGDSASARRHLELVCGQPVVVGRVTLAPPVPMEVAAEPTVDTREGVLILHAAADAEWARRLARHAAPLLQTLDLEARPVDDAGGVAAWPHLRENLQRDTRVVLLLLSPSYLASPLWNLAEGDLLALAGRAQLRLLWAMAHACDWAATPYVAYPCANQPGQPFAGKVASHAETLMRHAADALRRACSGIVSTEPQPLPVPRGDGHVFIAYRHADGDLIARRLHAELVAVGLGERVFLDQVSLASGKRKRGPEALLTRPLFDQMSTT